MQGVLTMNLKNYILCVSYSIGDIVKTIEKSDDVLSFSECKEDNHIILKVNTTKDVNILKAKLIYNRKLDESEFFFSNGYQSWTTTKEYKTKDRQYGLFFLLFLFLL